MPRAASQGELKEHARMVLDAILMEQYEEVHRELYGDPGRNAVVVSLLRSFPDSESVLRWLDGLAREGKIREWLSLEVKRELAGTGPAVVEQFLDARGGHARARPEQGSAGPGRGERE